MRETSSRLQVREEELKAVKKELDEILGQSENSVAGLHKELSDALTKHSKCSVERRGGRGREREVPPLV